MIRTLFANLVHYTTARIRHPKVFEYRGLTIPLAATPEFESVRRSMYRGAYEGHELQALAKLIKPEDVVLELGAGLGVVSTFIAKRLNSPEQLTTVEANPRLLPSIEAVAAQNGLKLKVLQGAVGARDGSAEFFFANNFHSSSTLDRGLGAQATVVETLAFDRLLRDIKPSVVVFDIEGGEVEIFADPLPASVRVVCGEMHPHIVGDAAITRIIESFFKQGFVLRVDQSLGRAFAFERD